MFLHQRVSRLDEGFFFYNSIPAAKGLTLYLIGDYDGAAKAYWEHYRRVYQENEPADSESYALLRGDLGKAKELAERNLKAHPFALQSLLTLGEIAIQGNSFPEALKRFERVLEIETDQYDALLLSSVAYARLGDYGKAIQALNQALRNDRIQTRVTSFLKALEITGELERLNSPQRPLSLLAHYHRYFRIFDPDQGDIAIAYANKAIRAGDHPDDSYFTLGVVYTKQWRTEQVLQAFLNAVRINPQHAEALRWASRTYGKREDLVNEYTFMKAAHEAAPEDAFYVEALSYVLTEKLGDFRQALSLNLQWFPKSRHNVNFLSRLGGIYFYLGEYRLAIDQCQSAVSLDSHFYDCFMSMGLSHYELDEFEESAAAYRQAVALRPYSPEAHNALATIYGSQKRYREAIDQYEEGFKLGANDPDRLKGLCWMYFEVSDFQKAVRCYERVLEEQPNDANARHQLAFALRNLRQSVKP